MRITIFTSVLLAAPLAVVNAGPESDYETQEQQQQQQQQEQQQAQEFEQTEFGQETEQEIDEAAQETGQQFEEAGQEMEQAGEQAEQGFEQTEFSQDQQAAQAQQQGGGEAAVKRAQFTTEVQNREPVDEVQNVQVSEEPVFFFTEVENAAGQTITHRWKHDGEVMAEVPLEVGSDEWRTWSSKELMPEWEGEWTVEVVDAQGNTITEERVTVEGGQQMQQASQQEDQQGQMQQAGQQEDQQGQMQEAGQQDQQAQEEDWQDVEFEEDAAAEDEPLFQDTAEDQEAEETTEEEEDWVTRQ